MPYATRITRKNPTCYVFLIDQSGSMSDPWTADPARKKADELATIVNRCLYNLVVSCSKGEKIFDYFYVAVIGYGESVGPAFTGPLTGVELAAIGDIARKPDRVEERVQRVSDGVGGLVEQKISFPVWFDAVANNGTPMCEGLQYANRIVAGWLKEHDACFPPTVFHITDGESTDGDPSELMQTLKGMASSDGNVLLFNIHLSGNPDAREMMFCESADGLPDEYARMLFENSSTLTPFMRSYAKKKYDRDLSENARGFLLNAAKGDAVIMALDIGSSQPVDR